MFVTWEDLRGATSDVYTQHVRADGVADPAWPVDGRATCAATGNQTRPQVLGDGLGGAFVAWTDARAGLIPSLYAQHLLADGLLDPTWPSSDLNFCAVFGSHLNLVLLRDGVGGALAMWDDNRSGLNIYAHHLQLNGVDPTWPVNGLGVSTATNSQNAAGAVIEDGSGGLIATWSDTRVSLPNSNDIYAQRVQANGQLGGTVLDAPVGRRSPFALAPPAPTPSRSGRLGVRYTLPREGHVALELLDVAGRLLATRDLGVQGAGPHAFDWDPRTRVPTGLHFVRLSFGGEKRMTHPLHGLVTSRLTPSTRATARLRDWRCNTYAFARPRPRIASRATHHARSRRDASFALHAHLPRSKHGMLRSSQPS